MTNKKKIIIISAAAALAVAVSIGGITAFFADADDKTNTFTIGKVELDLSEPAWDALPDTDNDGIPDDAEDVVPLDKIAKDPKVTNTGVNNEYIFLDITVPVYTGRTLAYTDTGKKDAGPTNGEVFNYCSPDTNQYYGDLATALANNSDFRVIGYKVNGTKITGTNLYNTALSAAVSNADSNGFGSLTYIVAYQPGGNAANSSSTGSSSTLKALSAGSTTKAVFSNIQMKHFVESQYIENKMYFDIPIIAYGIQTNNVPANASTTMAVYEIIEGQEPSTIEKGA